MDAIQLYRMSEIDELAVKNQIMPGATQTELMMFRNVCERTGLNPFNREIYPVERWKKGENGPIKTWSFQISIDGYRLMAERSGLYVGQGAPEWCGLDGKWRDIWTLEQPPYAARVTVYRKGCPVGTVGIAYYKMSVALKKDGNALEQWSKSPAHMLAKAAEANALRRAFPLNYGGAVEFQDDDIETEEQEQAIIEKPQRSAAQIVASLGGDDEPIEAQISQPARATVTPERKANPAPAPAKPEMPLDMAEKVANRDGVLYRDLDSEKLSYMIASMTKAIANQTGEEREATEYKLAAARAILASRDEVAK